MNEIKPPQEWIGCPRPWVFLAGSIKMGADPNWQATAVDWLSVIDGTILNPRRDDWDSTWEQDIGNPQFREQVNWELDGLILADLVLVYFVPGTKSPITLLELGLAAIGDWGHVMVCCPKGFWRKGNVDIVCNRRGLDRFDAFEDMIAEARRQLRGFSRKNETDT